MGNVQVNLIRNNIAIQLDQNLEFRLNLCSRYISVIMKGMDSLPPLSVFINVDEKTE